VARLSKTTHRHLFCVMAKELLLFRRAEHPSVTAYTDGRLLALAPNVALLRGVDLIPHFLSVIPASGPPSVLTTSFTTTNARPFFLLGLGAPSAPLALNIYANFTPQGEKEER
jgi:hypothetical protein